MIARHWTGQTLESDAEAYSRYIDETGVTHIRETSGNRGVWVLRRICDGKATFMVISHWDTLEAIKAFAGPEYEKAVYYPEDKNFLLSLDPNVTHYEILFGSESLG